MRLGERCDAIIRLIEQALEDDHGGGRQAVQGPEAPAGRRSAQRSAAISPAGADLEHSG